MKFILPNSTLTRHPRQIIAKKSLGQNFLTDPNIIRKILESCQLSASDVVFEIGSGLGALTHHLTRRVNHLIAIEKDSKLCQKLKNELVVSNADFLEGDFLKYDLSLLPQKVKLIGNIPYNISSSILNKLIQNRERFSVIFLTLQLEFANRLLAKPNTKDYSSLTCFVQYFCKVKLLFKIKNTCFYPVPKVDSCFVMMTPYEQFPFCARNEELLFKIIRSVFQHRRKTLAKTLMEIIPDRQQINLIFQRLSLEPNLRPENLALSNFVDLANAVDDMRSNEEGNLSSL